MARPRTSTKIATEVESTPITPRRKIRDLASDIDSPIHPEPVDSKFPSETEDIEDVELVVEDEEEREQYPATGALPLTYVPITPIETNPVELAPSKGRILTIEVSKTRQFEDFEPDRCTIVYELGVGEEEVIEDVYFELRQQVYDLLDMPLEDK
jgi:hypothetical protein